MRLSLIVTLVVFTQSLISCKVEEKIAPRDELKPVEIQKVALGDPSLGDLNNQQFTENKFFLWKKPTDRNVVKSVLTAAKDFDKATSELKNIEKQLEALGAGAPDFETAPILQNQTNLMQVQQQLLIQIISSTEFFEGMPQRVNFNFEGDNLRIDVDGWPDAGRSFTSDDGSIRNIKLESDKMVVRFEVVTASDEYYRFRFERSSLDKATGKVAYQGEMFRVRNGEEQPGVAKLGMP